MTSISNGLSSLLSFCIVLVLFAGMQVFKTQLASTQPLTIIGGYFASLVFVFLLTAISNVEAHLFGPKFQAQVFPEVIVSLLLAVISAGMIHRVCTTTCVIFSLIGLYCINRVSTGLSSTSSSVTVAPSKTRRGQY